MCCFTPLSLRGRNGNIWYDALLCHRGVHVQEPALFAAAKKRSSRRAKGRVLRGQSAPRRYGAARQGDAILLYLGPHRPGRLSGWLFKHVDGELAAMHAGMKTARYRVEVIDTWNMRTDVLPGLHGVDSEVQLPGRPWLALRLTPVGERR